MTFARATLLRKAHPNSAKALASGMTKFLTMCCLLVSVSCQQDILAEDSLSIDAQTSISTDVIRIGEREGVDSQEIWELWPDESGTQIVRNVSEAGILPVCPLSTDQPPRAAVLILPGGANKFLSLEREGTQIAEVLLAEDYCAFILIYRTIPTPIERSEFDDDLRGTFRDLAHGISATNDNAVIDVERALKFLTNEASSFNIDPEAISVLGFSAGGRVLQEYINVAPTEQMPAQVALIYANFSKRLIASQTPPMFGVLASDDPLYGASTFSWIVDSRRVNSRIEFHYYESGGHGFGIGKAGTSSENWFEAYLNWLNGNQR